VKQSNELIEQFSIFTLTEMKSYGVWKFTSFLIWNFLFLWSR
jgi:hypothetical protein